MHSVFVGKSKFNQCYGALNSGKMIIEIIPVFNFAKTLLWLLFFF